jgi:hypothetical protein
MLVRIEQVRDPDAAIRSPVPIPQVGADSPLRRLGVRVIAVIQDHLLHVTEADLSQMGALSRLDCDSRQ